MCDASLMKERVGLTRLTLLFTGGSLAKVVNLVLPTL